MAMLVIQFVQEDAHVNRPQIGFEDQLSLNAGQKYCRMLQGEHSAILSTFIKQGEHSAIHLIFINLPFVIKIVVVCIFEWPFYTGFVIVKRSCVSLVDKIIPTSIQSGGRILAFCRCLRLIAIQSGISIGKLGLKGPMSP